MTTRDLPSLAFHYEPERDLIWIEGIAYAGLFFRLLSIAEPGTWLRIEERSDGVISMSNTSDSLSRTFDALSGRGRIKAARK